MALNAAYSTNDPRYEQIDSEIAQLEATILELTSRRNSLAPISKLPTEILCTIFKWCSLPPYILPPPPQAQSSSPVSRPNYNWHWVVVSHVSHHWRSAALSCPALWSRLDFRRNRPRWIHEKIVRSKDASLTIDLNTSSSLSGLREALTHLNRIEVLRLGALSDEIMHEILAPLFSLTSESNTIESLIDLIPRLHTLSISIGTDGHYESREPFPLPSHFLSSIGGAAKLRRLELTNCHLPGTSSLYRNLTHLKVHNSSAIAPSMDGIFRALQVMSELQELDLARLHSGRTQPSPQIHASVLPIPRPVVLPHLRTFRVCGKIDECATFLMNIRIPLSAHVHLQVECGDAPARDDNVLRSIEEFCRTLLLAQEQTDAHVTPSEIRSMFARTSMKGSGVLIEASYGAASSSYKSPSSLSLTPTRSRPNLTLDVTWPSQPHFYHIPVSLAKNTNIKLKNQCQVLSSICSVLPLHELTDLHVDFPLKLESWDGRHGRKDIRISDPVVRRCSRGARDSGSPMHTLASLFGALPGVTSLTLKGHSAPGFVDILGGIANSTDSFAAATTSNASRSALSTYSTSLPFPSLRSLSLLEVDFDRFDWHTHPPHHHTASASSSNGPQFDVSSPDPSDISVMIRPLSNALNYRIERGAHLHDLVLEGCAFLCPSSVEKLKEIVEVDSIEDKGQVLRWDGLEIVYADDDTKDVEQERRIWGHGY